MKGAIDCSLSWLSLPRRLRQVKSYSLVNRWLSNKVAFIVRTWEAICNICDSNPSFLSASSWIKGRGGGRLKRNDCGSAMEVKITWNTEQTLPRNWYIGPLIMTTTWSALAGSSLQPPSPFPILPALLCAQKKTHNSTRFAEKSTLFGVRVGRSLVLLLLLERSRHF